MTYPSDKARAPRPDQLQDELAEALYGYPRLAPDGALYIAMQMLETQIASRRQIIGQGGLTVAEVDGLSLEVQQRVDRIRRIVAELRRRGLTVEWEE